MVGITVHGVCNTVIADVHQEEQIFSPDGLMEGGFTFPASKAGCLKVHQIVVLAVAVKGRVFFYLVIVYASAEFNQIIVDLPSHFAGGAQGNDF